MQPTLRDPNPPLTRSVEDYLKAIYHLSSQGGFAATSDIAAMLEVAPPSVSGMEQRLTPGVLLTVSDRQPFNGPTTIALVPSGDPRVVGRELAQLLLCQEIGS